MPHYLKESVNGVLLRYVALLEKCGNLTLCVLPCDTTGSLLLDDAELATVSVANLPARDRCFAAWLEWALAPPVS